MTNINFIFIILCFLSVGPNIILAQEIVVEAPRISPEAIDPSRSATVISEQEIKKSKASTVSELLRTIPGVELIRQGSIGQTTSIFIRGAKSESTLVLIDGMEVNDVMSPANGFDFSSLLTNQIKRIEIYRGPQSVRFGAGALGGVVNIITKSGSQGKKFGYLIESGSYNTHRLSLQTTAGVDRFQFSLGAEGLNSEGFSAASGGVEKDGAYIQALSSKLTWQPGATAKLNANIRWSRAQVDIDRQGGASGDDPNNNSDTKQFLIGVRASDRFWQQQLKSTLGFYYTKTERDNLNQPDQKDTTDSKAYFLGEGYKVQAENDLILGDHHTLRVGLQWRQEKGQAESYFLGTETIFNNKSKSTIGGSWAYLYDSDTWYSDVGIRLDHHSTVGDITSYRTSLGRHFPNSKTKVTFTYGSGFKLPSLYQLYSPYGDIKLKQENSNTADLSLQKTMGSNILLRTTYFESQFSNLIEYSGSTNRYFNVAKAKSRGIETDVRYSINSNYSLNANYTYLDTNDESTGLELLRRSRHTASMTLNHQADNYDYYIRYRYREKRFDIDPVTFQRITTPGYDVVAVGVSIKYLDQYKINGRIENVFDKTYAEVAGYSAPGVSVYLGLAKEI